MFRQIDVHPEDQRCQTVLWRNASSGLVQWHHLTTVTYGLACSPYLANRTVRQLATDEGPRFPLAAAVVRTDMYVDDLLTGGDDLQQAKELRNELVGLFKAGGFSLKKWAANFNDVLVTLPHDVLEPTELVRIEDAPTLRTLGLHWEAAGDCLRFQVTSSACATVTKRSVLSATATLFDPLGWLAPVTIAAKTFLQQLWLLWADSTVTLAWVCGAARQWKTYVANRVAEIQTTLAAAHWHHLPGAQNPADCASRGIRASELAPHRLWWTGPPWLAQPSSCWPADHPGRHLETEKELRVRVHVATSQTREPWDLLLRYSSLQRLLRITALVRRFIRLLRLRCRHASNDQSETGVCIVTPQETQSALVFWTQHVQEQHFGEVLTGLQSNDSMPTRSQLTPLRPFLDQSKLLRVGGRLKHSLLDYDEKHPVIMPSKSPLTTLIVRQAHEAVLHGGTQATLAYLRRRYWILAGRRTVRSYIHRCIPCVRQRAQPHPPLMASLPLRRVTPPTRAFLHAGVDYAGPLSLVTAKGRGRKTFKGFVALFVCLATRAVHLEAVSDYSSDAFLAAYQRFCARRGICGTLTSDRGRTLVGADTALRALFDKASAEFRKIARSLADQGTTWRFNPPSAPHFGGIWESAVKSVKHHLRRVIGDHRLTFEEFATFLVRVEACLNSRPLHPLTDDPEDLSALTPGHFLVSGALNAVPGPSYQDLAETRLSRWQRLCRMQCDFWRR